MFRSLGLAIGLALSAMPVMAQSATEARLEGVYSQLGFDVGTHYCDGLKTGNFKEGNVEQLTIFLNGRLTPGEIELVMSVFQMDEDNVYRELFDFNMWRALKYGGCQDD
jgi:hypothetical protein